ncbi:MAG: hypothetical protein ACJ71M_03830, partial [Nitrososphaeraceae archaeon]
KAINQRYDIMYLLFIMFSLSVLVQLQNNINNQGMTKYKINTQHYLKTQNSSIKSNSKSMTINNLRYTAKQ